VKAAGYALLALIIGLLWWADERINGKDSEA